MVITLFRNFKPVSLDFPRRLQCEKSIFRPKPISFPGILLSFCYPILGRSSLPQALKMSYPMDDSSATHAGFWIALAGLLVALPQLVTWNFVNARELWCDQTLNLNCCYEYVSYNLFIVHYSGAGGSATHLHLLPSQRLHQIFGKQKHDFKKPYFPGAMRSWKDCSGTKGT